MMKPRLAMCVLLLGLPAGLLALACGSTEPVTDDPARGGGAGGGGAGGSSEQECVTCGAAFELDPGNTFVIHSIPVVSATAGAAGHGQTLLVTETDAGLWVDTSPGVPEQGAPLTLRGQGRLLREPGADAEGLTVTVTSSGFSVFEVIGGELTEYVLDGDGELTERRVRAIDVEEFVAQGEVLAWRGRADLSPPEDGESGSASTLVVEDAGEERFRLVLPTDGAVQLDLAASDTSWALAFKGYVEGEPRVRTIWQVGAELHEVELPVAHDEPRTIALRGADLVALALEEEELVTEHRQSNHIFVSS